MERVGQLNSEIIQGNVSQYCTVIISIGSSKVPQNHYINIWEADCVKSCACVVCIFSGSWWRQQIPSSWNVDRRKWIVFFLTMANVRGFIHDIFLFSKPSVVVSMQNFPKLLNFWKYLSQPLSLLYINEQEVFFHISSKKIKFCNTLFFRIGLMYIVPETF